MIEVTDEMVQLALDIFLATPTDTIAQIDAGAAKALAAVFELVERDYDTCWRGSNQCLCAADLGHPWDSVPHLKGTRGCRNAP